MHEPHYVSLTQFARRNGLSRASVYRALERGELTALKAGGRTLIEVAEEQRWRASLRAWRPRAVGHTEDRSQHV